MAQGTFIEGEDKARPGVYFLLKAAATSRVARGTKGRVALPVRADWGPEGPVAGFQSITDETDIKNLFWNARAGNTVRLLSLTWKTGPQQIVAYRLVGTSGAAATVTLQDTAGSPANVVQLTARYKGARPNANTGAWTAVIATNLDDGTKKDLKLLEGAATLATWTFDTTPTSLVAAVNADGKGYLGTATKLADGSAVVANTAGVAFAGGDSGLTVVNQAYLDWLAALEAYKEFDALALDGVGDPTLQDSVITWLGKVRGQGLWVQAALGHAADTDPAAATTRAGVINKREVVYVISGGYLPNETTVYTPADAAAWVAGKMAATLLNASFTGAATPFSKIGKRLTDTQIKAALPKGALCFDEASGVVTVERALNTLNTPASDQDISWGSIKVSSIIDAVETDLGKALSVKFIGKVPNTPTSRSAITGAVLEYYRILAADSVLQNDYAASEDAANPSTGNAANFVTSYRPVDAVEKVYFRSTIAS